MQRLLSIVAQNGTVKSRVHKLSSAGLRKLLQTYPHFASVYCHGELVDGVRLRYEARKLGIVLPRVELEPIDAARVVFGCHPVRALELVRDHCGLGTIDALHAIGANNPNDASLSLDRLVSAYRSRKLRRVLPGDQAEGNPL